MQLEPRSSRRARQNRGRQETLRFLLREFILIIRHASAKSHAQCQLLGTYYARSGGRRSRLWMLSVPLDREPEPLLEVDPGLPADHLTDLRRIHVLAVDLTRWAASPADIRLHSRVRQTRDQLHDLAHRMGTPGARVEGLAANLGPVEGVPDRNVGARRVLDVKEVALRRAVGAQDRRTSVEGGADRLRDQ